MMGSRHIMLFSAGPVNPLIPEHVAQDFGATLHAATPCEAYRVGLYDILLATHCVRAKWYKHFEKLLEEVQVKVRLKLQGARSIQTMKLKKSRTEVSLNPLKKEEEGDKDRAMRMDFVAQVIPFQKKTRARLVGDRLLKLREDPDLYPYKAGGSESMTKLPLIVQKAKTDR